MSHKLTYTQHNEIDRHKWEHLVSVSEDSLVFYNSWYLDQFCQWDAIVYGDYLGAIVLPRKERLGIRTLYQPNFIQKCNWFGYSLSSSEKLNLWDLITSNFKNIHFNTNIDFSSNSIKRTNLVLKASSYAEILNGYSRSLKKNIKKNESHLIVQECKPIDTTIKLYREAYGNVNKQINTEDYSKLKSLVLRRPTDFVSINVSFNGEIISSILLAKGKKRLHYILGAPSKKGRELNALSVCLNYAIREYGSKGFILDFEGSNIPSVKKYYESFGAINEPFYEVKAASPIITLAKDIYNKVFKS
ncbi:MAG: hypothetical protein ACPGTP_02010 [Bacteroidia bacterium]